MKDPIVPIVQHGYPHFVVVRGLDSRGRIKLADPGFGNRTMSVEDLRGRLAGRHWLRGDAMKRLLTVLSITAGFGLLADTATAQTVEQLKKELAVKNAEIARLRGRVRELEGAGAPVRPMEPVAIWRRHLPVMR